MKFKSLHSWDVSVTEAIDIQKKLFRRFREERLDIKKIKFIAAADAGYKKNNIRAVCIILSFPELNIIEKFCIKSRIRFPYIPGLLTFREGPAILKALKKIRYKPQAVIFDGQGISHPRKMGIATHLGIILDIPSIGCAKSFLYGNYKEPNNLKGAYSFVFDRRRKIIGAAVRTRANVKPVFVSIGYKIDLKLAIKIVLKTTNKYRIPEPLRMAHNFSIR